MCGTNELIGELLKQWDQEGVLRLMYLDESGFEETIL